jgi:phage replication O-like protein O
MNNKKVEGMYTKIPNELWEAIARWRLSSYEYRVLLFIIRKTYGWNKKDDWISLSQFVEATQIKESHICRSISLLIKQNIITKGGNRLSPKYGVQKDYDQWVKLPKGVRSHHPIITKGGNSKVKKELPKGVIALTKGGNSPMKKGGDTKEIYITKETITKERVVSTPTPKENAERFFSGVLALVHKDPDVDVEWLKDLLKEMADKNPHVQKKIIWEEIRKFCDYWTERNHTGTRGRWEMQKTFEVDKRLATWFRRVGFGQFSADQFSKKQKGRNIIGL